MKFLIVGCGRAGAELAFRLSQAGNEVTIVDPSPGAFTNLHPEFRGRTIQGDALSEGVLESAGVGAADGVAAVTNSDAVNAVVAHIARKVFGRERVAVRSYHSAWRPLHEAFGHVSVNSTAWGAQRFEDLLSGRAPLRDSREGS